MAAIKLYSMQAKAGLESELGTALRDLAARIRPVAGCERVEIFQGLEGKAHFIFIEHWASLDMQKAGGKQLGKDAFQQVTLALGSPPVAYTMQAT